MPIWRYTEKQNWHQTIHKTPILPIEVGSHKEPNFIWPKWAINMVNELGANKLAIQTVSRLLERERKELWQLQT